MNKRTKKLQKGITLIALIITIIVILILAGVTIATLTGENGILNKSEKAAEETLIKGYEEKIRLATIEGKSNNLIDPEKYGSKEDILDDIGTIIKKDQQFKEADIYKTGEGTEYVKLVVVTKEGYVFYVEVDKIKYAGTKEEIGDIILDIEIQDGDITFTCEPNSWTNGNVELAIEIANESYKDYEIEYSYDTKNWNKYQKEQKIIVTENNTEIYTRLRSDNIVLGDGANKGIYASYMVKNIDKVEPNETTITLSGTTTDTEGSITATVTQSDSQSGIDISSCRWVLNTNSSTTIDESLYPSTNTFTTQTNANITLSSTTSGTYYLHVLTVDNAGNKKETVSKAVTVTTPTYNIGDEVTVGGESFYVLEESDRNAETVTLFAKYNLNKAGTAQYDATYEITECSFSGINYWLDDFTSDPFDLNDLGKESTGDAIAKAKSYAVAKGGINGRLLTYNEAYALKTSIGSDATGKIEKMLWGTESTDGALRYWLGTAYSDTNLHVINHKSIGGNMTWYSNDWYYGVRPVITISKSLVTSE